MKTRTDYLLLCLAEEGAEIGQAASKASRFGLDSNNPYIANDPINEEKILAEVIDVLAILNMLQADGTVRHYKTDEIFKGVAAKKQRVLDTMDWSIKSGNLRSDSK